MANSEKVADQFVGLLQRFMRLRPKLAFPDENAASLKRQLQGLRDGASTNPGERILLFRTLDVLTHNATPPTMGELSAELGIPFSSTTRLADSLVRAKFAERCEDADDRRVVRLCMTESGRQFIRLATGHIRRQMVHLLNRFSTEEQAQLLRLMNKLLDSIQADPS